MSSIGSFWRILKVNYFRNNKWQQILVAVVFIFFSSASFAVGFGKIKVYSYLNELLSAEIELIGVENIHTDLLVANLASPKDFVRANMARPFFLTKLSFEIIRHEEQTVIYVSSINSVKNPFLNFLVELSLPDGKLVKGYTILIDPPPKTIGLSKRPQALKKRKALVNETTKFDLPKSVENTSAIAVPENNKIMATTAPNNADNIIADSAAVANALGDNIEINNPTKTTGLLSGVVSMLKVNPLLVPSVIDSKQLEEKNAANSTKTEQQANNVTTLKDLLAQDTTKVTEPVAVKVMPTDSNIITNIAKTETTPKLIEPQNNTAVADKTLYKKYGLQLILSFLMVLISCVFIIKILRRSHIAAIDATDLNPEESADLTDIDEAIAEITRQESHHYDEEIDLSSNDLPGDSITVQPEFEAIDLELLSDNNGVVDLKINLAKQYIEAGDSVNAKSILTEIIDIAGPVQKEAIENILKTLITSAA